MLQHGGWSDVPGLQHGFLDRRDCRGAGPWDPIVARVGIALPVHTARQVHGVAVVVAPVDPRIGDRRPAGDAVVSAERGLAVGVVTADCVPILLLARERGVVAAVHAGWRGAAAGVIEATLDRLRAAFAVEPGDVEACIGPAIGGCCYQVGVEVHDAFVARTGDLTASAWRPDGDRHRVDLRRAVQSLLAAAGVERVDVVGPCTMCGDGWCSYRRDGTNAGRQLGVIGWT